MNLFLILGVSLINSLFSPDGLYDQKALQEYILYAGQHPVGGLRDKPPKYMFCSIILLPQDPIADIHRSIGMQTHIILFIA